MIMPFIFGCLTGFAFTSGCYQLYKKGVIKMNPITEFFEYVTYNFKEFVTTCLFICFLWCLLAVGIFVYSNHTQVAIYSQDIPPNLVCIKDTIPDAYLCSPDATVPWYLSSEGVLANVQ